MNILMKEIRAWWLQKPIAHNVPSTHDALFEEFIPSIGKRGHEWIRVISLDDLHLKINIISRYVELCDELAKVKAQLVLAEEALGFYRDGAQGDDCEPKPEKAHLYDQDYPMYSEKWLMRSMSDNHIGKRAREYFKNKEIV